MSKLKPASCYILFSSILYVCIHFHVDILKVIVPYTLPCALIHVNNFRVSFIKMISMYNIYKKNVQILSVYLNYFEKIDDAQGLATRSRNKT